jgi:hypothetical protein
MPPGVRRNYAPRGRTHATLTSGLWKVVYLGREHDASPSDGRNGTQPRTHGRRRRGRRSYLTRGVSGRPARAAPGHRCQGGHIRGCPHLSLAAGGTARGRDERERKYPGFLQSLVPPGTPWPWSPPSRKSKGCRRTRSLGLASSCPEAHSSSNAGSSLHARQAPAYGSSAR